MDAVWQISAQRGVPRGISSLLRSPPADGPVNEMIDLPRAVENFSPD